MKRIGILSSTFFLLLAGIVPVYTQQLSITNLSTGEVRSGTFDVKGNLSSIQNIKDVKVRINGGPWAVAFGQGSWTYRLNPRDIPISSEYRYDPLREEFVLVHRRGVVYGDVTVTAAAFDNSGFIVDQKSVDITIIPEPPVIATEIPTAPYVHTGTVIFPLEASPELEIYFTINGDDPVAYGLPYTEPIILSSDTIVKVVTKSENGVCSDVLAFDIAVDPLKGPEFYMQYYADAQLTQPLSDNPHIQADKHYIKFTASEALQGFPSIVIDAEGSANDVGTFASPAPLTQVGGNEYVFERVIGADALAVGAVKENIFLKAVDADGNTSGDNTSPPDSNFVPPINWSSKAAFTDTSAPTLGAPAISFSGTPPISDPTPTLTLDATDADFMRFALSQAGLASASWVEYSGSYDEFDISQGELFGNRTVYVQFKDLAGNISTSANTSTVIYDSSTLTFDIRYFYDPEYTISYWESNPYLAAGTYYLKIAANQDLATNPQVSINAEGATNDVTNGDTEKVSARVYRFKRIINPDSAAVGAVPEDISINGATDNISNEATRAAYTDTTVPSFTAINDIAWTNAAAPLSVTITGESPLTYKWSKIKGSGEVIFGDAEAASTTVQGTNNYEKIFTLRLFVSDAAGNSAGDTFTFQWDKRKPAGGITIEGGAAYATSTGADLSILGSDGGSGVKEMWISNDSGFSAGNWETFAVSKSWSLTAGDGDKTVYIKLRDNAGNISNVYEDSIILDSTAPAAVSGFMATSETGQNVLSWTNPGLDFAGVIITGTADSTWTPTPGTEYEEGFFVDTGVQVLYIGTGDSFTQTGIVNDGSTMYYRAFTYDQALNYSIAATASVTVVDEIPPPEVINFYASYDSGNSEVDLSWFNPSSSDFAGVRIMRKTGSAPTDYQDGTPIYDGTGTSTSDAAITLGTTYYYAAFTYDGATPKNYSQGVSLVITPGSTDTIPPGAVTNFTATPGDGHVTLSWTNPADSDFAGVVIRRSTISQPLTPGQGDFVYSGSGTGFDDTGLNNGTLYYYTAFAYDSTPNYSSGANTSATPQDVDPPTVILTVPADEETAIPVDTVVRAQFSESMNPSTIKGTTFTLSDASGSITGTVTYNDLNKTAFFTPEADLDFGTEYTASVSAQVKDVTGNAMGTAKTWTFTTRSKGYWNTMVWDADEWN